MTYFWIAVLAFSITALVLMVIHDRGVRAVLNTMAIVARAEGLDPEKMRVWLEQERLKTPWRARVSWSLWTGIVSFVVSNDVVARYARSSPEIQILLSRFRAAHPGETAQSGAWPVPNEEELATLLTPEPVAEWKTEYSKDHEICRQKFLAYANGLEDGDFQGLIVLYVTKSGDFSYRAHLNCEGDAAPITDLGFESLRAAARGFDRDAPRLLRLLREDEARRRANP